MTRRRSVFVLGILLSCALLPASPEARNGKRRGHDDSVIAGRDCSECHTTESWRLSEGAGGGFDHAQTGFPLLGAHRLTTCSGCHVPERETTRECSGCHSDAHQGRLGIQCDQCHDLRAWQGTRAIQRHRMTRLPLTGVHAMLDCTSCHIRTASQTWSQVPANCFACHEDDYRSDIHPPHVGDPGDPEQRPFPRDCAQCHRAIAWRPAFADPALLGIARGQGALSGAPGHDVRFPISFGKHRGAPCESCHLQPATPRALTCTGCHEHGTVRLLQQHRGRSVSMDAAACLRCHPGGVSR
jgi:hypothetical protein